MYWMDAAGLYTAAPPPDTKAEKSTGNQYFDVPANVCNQQVGGSNPSTSSNAS